jgi:F0F1-type ATP synthase membrane subunit b/b'
LEAQRKAREDVESNRLKAREEMEQKKRKAKEETEQRANENAVRKVKLVAKERATDSQLTFEFDGQT